MFITVTTEFKQEPIFININNISYIVAESDNDSCIVFMNGDNEESYFNTAETYDEVKSKIKYALGVKHNE